MPLTRLAAFAGMAAAVVCGIAGARAAEAHELRPALLSITAVASRAPAGPGAPAPADYDVELRVPVAVLLDEAPTPIFPPGSARLGDPTRTRAGDYAVERFRVRVPGGLPGQHVAMRFFRASSASEVLVRFDDGGGRAAPTGRLVPDRARGEATWQVPVAPRPLTVAATYLRLGVEHIFTGLDHLAFVLGLVLLTPAWRKLWKTITAFTAAHSLTLALAALGLLRLPPPPVEAAIALSILFVAREAWFAARGPADALPPSPETPIARRPWLIAFAFGLLHGLGFAGALAEVGLPDTDLPLALLTFNLGVELGQLAFVAAALLAGRALGRLPWARRPLPRQLPAYAIGTLAVFWCLQRIGRFWA